MSNLITTYALKMSRKGEGKVEVTVVSGTLHKNNLNVQELIKAGFEVSDTLGRSKGGVSFGNGAQFTLFVVGTDAQAKALDGKVYGELVALENPVKTPVKVVEQPVQQAEIPQEVESAEPVVAKKATRKVTKKVDSAE